MDTTPRPGHAPSTFRSTPVRTASETAPHPHRHHASHPANLPAATTTAYRYSFRDGQLIRL